MIRPLPPCLFLSLALAVGTVEAQIGNSGRGPLPIPPPAAGPEAPPPATKPLPPPAPIPSGPREEAGENLLAIVRVDSAEITPDYRTPWNAGSPSRGSGTGFLIGPNRFLTNAHVVSNSTHLIIRKYDNPRPLPARVVFIAHDCDLAILELVDPKPFDKVTPLHFGEVPKLNTEVIVVGYPVGGERVSITRGIVSRIDFSQYSHSAVDQHLTVQVDAAINPGNSGGPVLQKGKVVGVAFQGYNASEAQNVGYMIPTPVIHRFLTDVKDGRYDHYVELGVSEFPIQNPGQVKALGLPDSDTGVFVGKVVKGSSADGKVQVGDVLLEIDGHAVSSNGLIRVEGEFMNMNEAVERHFAGEKVKLKIWRDRKEVMEEVELKPFTHYLIQANRYGDQPHYILYGGLVFQPLERNLLEQMQNVDPVARHWYNTFVNGELYLERPEPVVLTNVLADEINSQFGSFAGSLVDTINGVKITNLQSAHDALYQTEAKNGFVVIELLHRSRPLILEKAALAEAQSRIRRTYDITLDHYLGEPEKESPNPAPAKPAGQVGNASK